MTRLPNVHFLGGKRTERLGAYPQHFDVCIMPYILDDYTKYIYPLKLHEYLASGTPVISARIPVVEDFRKVVSIAGDSKEWSQAIERAFSREETNDVRRAERQAVARQHDWGTLVEKIARVIGQRLAIQIPRNDVAEQDSVDFESAADLH